MYRQAVKHYCDKLRSFRSQSFPVEWALCHFELALAFVTKSPDDRMKELDEALFHLQACVNVRLLLCALSNHCLWSACCDDDEHTQVFTMHAFPLHWAVVQLMQAELLVEMLQMLLYAPHSSLTTDGSRHNLERKGLRQALACLESALMVFDSENHPCEHALVLFTMVSAAVVPAARKKSARPTSFACVCVWRAGKG